MPEDSKAQIGFPALYTAILRSRGIELPEDARIFDYGCGSGRITYQFIDAGFANISGYDVADYVKLRSAEDAARFRFDFCGGAAGTFPRMSRVPFPDNEFDFVYATSVFEHVMDPEIAYREINRILKPGGWFLNDFPSMWRPIEPHIYVPFGGAIQSRLWYMLWALLGVRNEYQISMSAKETTNRNRDYAKRGINYITGRDFAKMMDRVFGGWEYVDDAFIQHSPGRSRHLAPLIGVPGFRRLFRMVHSRVVLAQKKAI